MISKVEGLSLKSAINAVFPQLLNMDEPIKWRAVELGGFLIASLADKDIEAGRIYIRRLIWTLTEESGGCPFGSPELIGESLANHEGLAHDFANVLISYLVPDGNYLDYEPLLRGAVWSVGRLAVNFPELTVESAPFLCELTQHKDDYVKGIACWALGNISRISGNSLCDVRHLQNDQTEITIMVDKKLTTFKIGFLAGRLMK